MVQLKKKERCQISVVVPVYNSEKRLRGCLDALLAQTFSDFELILVNDGSTDGSLQICREYKAAFPEKITLLDGLNRGGGGARNRGMDAAAGEWLIFCDSDDCPEADWLRILHAHAVRDNADLSCCSLREISPSGERIRMNFPMGDRCLICGPEEIHRVFLLPLLCGARTVHGYLAISLFRRSLIQAHRIRFVPEVFMKEDELFYLDFLSVAERITAANLPLYRYLRSDESVSARFREASVFRRELNWYQYARERRRIFYHRQLAEKYPVLKAEMDLRMYLHLAQSICCEPDSRFGRRMKKLRKIADEARKEQIGTVRGLGGIFRFCLLHFPLLVPLLCRLKRRKDDWETR